MRVPHRLLRAVVATVMATGAGTGAHLLGGGSATTAGIAVALVALFGPIWLLAGRERPFVVVAAAQLAGQQLVHAGFELGGPAHVPLPDDVSLCGHLLAAAAIAGWLRSGERRVWAACRRTARALAACCAPHVPAVPAPRALLLPSDVARVPLGRVLRHVLVRRGPPPPHVLDRQLPNRSLIE